MRKLCSFFILTGSVFPILAFAANCRVVNVMGGAPHVLQIECAGKLYWTDWSEVPNAIKHPYPTQPNAIAEYGSNSKSAFFNFVSNKAYDTDSSTAPTLELNSKLISTALPGQGCTYTSDRSNGGVYIITNTVSDAPADIAKGTPNCKDYKVFENFQIAKLTCGGGFDQIVICHRPTEPAFYLDPTSCYKNNTVPQYKQRYFADSESTSTSKLNKSPAAIGEWADPKLTSLGGVRLIGPPTVITLSGKQMCYASADNDSPHPGSSMTITGPAEKSGKCDFQNLMKDECFKPKSELEAADHKINYKLLPEELANKTPPSDKGTGNESSKATKGH